MDRETKERLKNDLKTLGVKRGDTVLMHSAYKPLGLPRGEAKEFFDAFFEVLGEEGTLVLPTLSYDCVTRTQPNFDYEQTKSCVGYLSEFFRTEVDGVVRSMHATHSCAARGRLAEEITKDHELDLTPVGKNSPFAKLPLFDGKILMLGCSFCSNTSLHGVEETAEPPYCIDRKNPVQYCLIKGDKRIEQTAYRHYFLSPDGKHYLQRYDKILDLLDEKDYSIGSVLSAKSCLMNARAVWEKGREKLLENPLYFVELPEE